MHSPGQADLNLYAYVHGSLLEATDPVGLETDKEKVEGVLFQQTNGLVGTDPNAKPPPAPAPDPAHFEVADPPLIDTGRSINRARDEGAANGARNGVLTTIKNLTAGGYFLPTSAGPTYVLHLALDAARAEEAPPVAYTLQDEAKRQAYGTADAGTQAVGLALTAFIPKTVSAVPEFGAADAAPMNTWTESGATVRHSATATAIGDDAHTLVNFARSKGAAGHDVIVHGAHDAAGEAQFVVDGKFTHAQQIADAVIANPAYRGGPINLVTCHGACGPAQELSGILGVHVNALPLKVDLHPVTGLLRVPF